MDKGRYELVAEYTHKFVIMQRCIFFWNREREEADCSFLLRQMKISWIGTGSG